MKKARCRVIEAEISRQLELDCCQLRQSTGVAHCLREGHWGDWEPKQVCRGWQEEMSEEIFRGAGCRSQRSRKVKSLTKAREIMEEEGRKSAAIDATIITTTLLFSRRWRLGMSIACLPDLLCQIRQCQRFADLSYSPKSSVRFTAKHQGDEAT